MTDQDENNRPNERPRETGPDIFWLLSGVYCMLIVILSIVICSSHYSTEDVTEVTVDVYYLVLTMIGSIWLISFGSVATRCGYYAGREPVKSTHSTNRWLKAILVIFGIAIIIKDVLELLTTTQYTDDSCKKVMYFLAPISEMVFIIAEVNFLFRYSKIHLQGRTTLNRFGTMHVMATNLSIWMLVIIDESMADDALAEASHPTAIPTVGLQYEHGNSSLLEKCNNTEILSALTGGDTSHGGDQTRRLHSEYISEQIFGPKGCSCDTDYCNAVNEAHSYLYPFLVEFSLVASCMVYIVWKNVGTKPQHTSPPVKPSYKFYKSYLGLAIGVLCLIVTVVILIFVNYGIETESSEGQYYNSHVTTMAILNSYMVGVEVAMFIACCVGAGLYRKDSRELEVELNLDIVLLLLTLIGVATMNMYYIFSVFISFVSERYEYNWIWGAVYPIVDLLQCIFQVGFILWGSARKPVTTDDLDYQVEFSQAQSTIGSSDSGIEVEVGFQNEAYDISDAVAPPNKIMEDIVVIKEDEIMKHEADVITNIDDVLSNKDEVITKEDEVITKEDEVTEIEGATTGDASDFVEGSLSEKRRIDSGSTSGIRRIPKLRRAMEKNALQRRIQQHSSRPRVAPPTLTRLRIRETLMFLLLANACLWMFWSLESPDIKELAYPNQYYSSHSGGTRNLWYRAAMFCLPLAIFFRMHSCACLFEMWSFT